MNVWVRMIVGIVGVLLLLAGLFSVGLYLGVFSLTGSILNQFSGEEGAGVTGGILLFLGLVLTGIGVRQASEHGEEDNNKSFVQFTENGEIRISYQAFENMVIRVTRQVNGARDAEARVRFSEAGLVVSVKVRALPDISLTELTSELQNRVKQYIEDISGAQIAEVKVFIPNIVVDNLTPRRRG